MKKEFLLMAALCLYLSGFAQTDTTGKSNPSSDTIKIGTMIIIKQGNPETGDRTEIYIPKHHHHDSYRPSNVSTNWLIVDLGFANYNDRTNYSSAEAQAFAPGSTDDWFSLKYGKSVDVNIWAFMQRLNVIKHVINLKYGLGIELNNYRYSENVKYLTSPTKVIMTHDSAAYSKNKLAADYVTVPLMVNFNFTPHRRHEFGLSAGVSAGYLYSSRQKTINSIDGKQKTHDSFDLNPWKISWIAELQFGPVKLYGSYATQSMFKKGLDQVPYTFGIRLSNW